MNPPLDHSVSLQIAAPRAIAAVRARVAMRRIPAVFAEHLNLVYAAARAGAVQLDGQNIFVYRNVPGADGEADAEFGVGVTAPFDAFGSVTCSMLPVGECATTTHRGAYTGLRAAHQSVIDWCRTHDRRRTGTRWEVYGHWSDDPSQLRTDVYHLLEPLA